MGAPWGAAPPTRGGHQQVAIVPLAYYVQSKFLSETPDLPEQFSKINWEEGCSSWCKPQGMGFGPSLPLLAKTWQLSPRNQGIAQLQTVLCGKADAQMTIVPFHIPCFLQHDLE